MINFVLSTTSHYAKVQDHILSLIKKNLDNSEYTETTSVKSPDALNFSLFVRQPTDVLMSHGVADKNYFWRKNEDRPGRRAAELKHAFVPGEWLRQRIIKSDLPLGEGQVHSVGWPRLDELYSMQASYDAGGREKSSRPKVLWAPTHDFARRGDDLVTLSSYPGFSEFVPELEKHADVQISIHPRNRKDKEPTINPLVEADVVVSDFGTMVYEAWALGKPVIFPDWIIRDPIMKHMKNGVSEKHIFQQNIGLHMNSFSELLDAVMNERTLGDDVKTYLHGYLDPRWKGCSAKRVAKLLKKLSPV